MRGQASDWQTTTQVQGVPLCPDAPPPPPFALCLKYGGCCGFRWGGFLVINVYKDICFSTNQPLFSVLMCAVCLLLLLLPALACSLVSRAGCGVKGEKLRQFCCVNGRPVELPRAVKTLNDTYRSAAREHLGAGGGDFVFHAPGGGGAADQDVGAWLVYWPPNPLAPNPPNRVHA